MLSTALSTELGDANFTHRRVLFRIMERIDRLKYCKIREGSTLLDRFTRSGTVYQSLGLLVCALTLTSCALTAYRDVPLLDVRTPPLPRRDIQIYFRVDPIAYFRQATYAAEGDFFYRFPARIEDYDELRRVFEENGVFAAAKAAVVPPDKGVYCSVQVEYVPLSKGEAFFLSLSHASAGIIPSYNGTSGHVVTYELYIDKELKKSYEYKIGTKQFIWLGLLPISWVNWLTYDLGDAFRATTYQFFVDAALDGYLTPP